MSHQRLRTVVICYGGGVDSTALIAYYLDLGFKVSGIHFGYGQPALGNEREAVEAISQHYQVPVVLSELRPSLVVRKDKECMGRNALFVLFAAQLLKGESGLISLGIHAGTSYYDCSAAFTKDMQQLLDGYYRGTVVLDVPFVNFTKDEILRFCEEREVPLDLTFSSLEELP